MNKLKKKARFVDYEGEKAFNKEIVQSWVLRPGKLGTGDPEPGVGLLIEEEDIFIELRLLRSELEDFLLLVNEKYPEPCDCRGCTGIEDSKCDLLCCPEIECFCADCEDCPA